MARRAALCLAAAWLLVAPEAGAERAWVKDELSLNLRTGADVKYRIIGAVKTGDAVDILGHTEGWTQVRTPTGIEGWVPEGYLQTEAPASIRLDRAETDARELREGYETLSREVAELRARNEELAGQESELRAQLERYKEENLELRAGARWPEWIAGASILVVGAILGIFVHWNSSRRGPRRIRL